MDERKGIFTEEQEKILDSLKDFDNPIIEAGDGLAIKLADNQGLERVKQAMEAKFPGSTKEFLYPIVDGIMALVAELAE